MSKRGLSTEEKRKRMLDFFFEKQDFFQLKDVEKLCSSEKGIVLQSIKDILTSLVDDGLVDSEKIGTSIYYWSLPSKALQKRREKIAQIETSLVAEKARNGELKSRLEAVQSSSQEDDEAKRGELMAEYKQLLAEKQRCERLLDDYRDNDPQAFEQVRAQVAECKRACNRWIENIFTLKSWLKNKFRLQDDVIDKQFEIPEELDYIS